MKKYDFRGRWGLYKFKSAYNISVKWGNMLILIIGYIEQEIRQKQYYKDYHQE